MRTMVFLIVLVILSACVTDDDISNRTYGQQLVCHKGHTKAVSTADSFVHLDHGDSPGPCPKEQ
ncbi:MAG: hypothetical protein WBS20_09835 [Lysobacterales bacterium]